MNYPYKNFSDRVDYNVNDKLRIYGRVGLHPDAGRDQQSDRLADFRKRPRQHAQCNRVTGNVTYTLSPTTVLNVRGDYHSFVDASNFVQAANAPTFSTIWPNQSFYAPVYADSGVPEACATNVDSRPVRHESECSRWARRTAGGTRRRTAKAWQRQLSQQRGNHFLKAGVEWRLSQVTQRAYRGESGIRLRCRSYLQHLSEPL